MYKCTTGPYSALLVMSTLFVKVRGQTTVNGDFLLIATTTDTAHHKEPLEGT